MASRKCLGGNPYPIFKNFYGGGLGSVRGFEQNSLGPVDVTGAYIGGNRKINFNGELYLPVPGTGNDRTRPRRPTAVPVDVDRASLAGSCSAT